jgi:hypothetical protein
MEGLVTCLSYLQPQEIKHVKTIIGRVQLMGKPFEEWLLAGCPVVVGLLTDKYWQQVLRLTAVRTFVSTGNYGTLAQTVWLRRCVLILLLDIWKHGWCGWVGRVISDCLYFPQEVFLMVGWHGRGWLYFLDGLEGMVVLVGEYWKGMVLLVGRYVSIGRGWYFGMDKWKEMKRMVVLVNGMEGEWLCLFVRGWFCWLSCGNFTPPALTAFPTDAPRR